jgi:hypothetical protein
MEFLNGQRIEKMYFSKEDIQMAVGMHNDTHIIRHQGDTNQNCMRCHYTPAKMATVKKI